MEVIPSQSTLELIKSWPQQLRLEGHSTEGWSGEVREFVVVGSGGYVVYGHEYVHYHQ